MTSINVRFISAAAVLAYARVAVPSPDGEREARERHELKYSYCGIKRCLIIDVRSSSLEASIRVSGNRDEFQFLSQVVSTELFSPVIAAFPAISS